MEATDRYSIHVFADEQDGGFVAVCPEFPGVSAFGDTRKEAIDEAQVALQLAIETFEEEGWPLPEPRGIDTQELPSGEFRLRLPRTLHALLAGRAEAEGVSQNQLVVAYVAAGLAGELWQTSASSRLAKLEAQMVGLMQDLRPVGSSTTYSAGRDRPGNSSFGDWQPDSLIGSGVDARVDTFRFEADVN